MSLLFLNVLAVFLLMAPGFWLRKRNLLSDTGTAELARLVPYGVYPCLIFTKIVDGYTLRGLAAEWVLPAAMAGLMLLGYAAGLATGLCGARSTSAGRRNSFLFQCAFNNYLFLPLPLVGMMFGERAMAKLILASLGGELAIWTLGVFILSRRGAVAAEKTGDGPREVILEDGIAPGLAGPLRLLLTPTLVAMGLAVGVVAVRDLAGTAWVPSGCAAAWGIESGLLKDIFKPYVSGRPGGHGIGLSMVRRLADAMGWRTEAASEAGKGTTMAIHGIRVVRT
jgi:predicted permease